MLTVMHYYYSAFGTVFVHFSGGGWSPLAPCEIELGVVDTLILAFRKDSTFKFFVAFIRNHMIIIYSKIYKYHSTFEKSKLHCVWQLVCV